MPVQKKKFLFAILIFILAFTFLMYGNLSYLTGSSTLHPFLTGSSFRFPSVPEIRGFLSPSRDLYFTWLNCHYSLHILKCEDENVSSS